MANSFWQRWKHYLLKENGYGWDDKYGNKRETNFLKVKWYWFNRFVGACCWKVQNGVKARYRSICCFYYGHAYKKATWYLDDCHQYLCTQCHHRIWVPETCFARWGSSFNTPHYHKTLFSYDRIPSRNKKCS